MRIHHGYAEAKGNLRSVNESAVTAGVRLTIASDNGPSHSVYRPGDRAEKCGDGGRGTSLLLRMRYPGPWYGPASKTTRPCYPVRQRGLWRWLVPLVIAVAAVVWVTARR